MKKILRLSLIAALLAPNAGAVTTRVAPIALPGAGITASAAGSVVTRTNAVALTGVASAIPAFNSSFAAASHPAEFRPDAVSAPVVALPQVQLKTALDRAFAEHPAEAAELDARVRNSPYGMSLGNADWKGELASVLGPRMALRAEQNGWTDPAEFAAFLNSDAPAAAAERAGLMKMLAHHTSHRAEDWTYLFRDKPLWDKPLDEYLDKQIAARKDSKTLDLQSVGAAYGSEAYTLAIVTDRALRRAGENPTDWKVSIKAYDVSLLSLLTAGRGLYRWNTRDQDTFVDSGADKYFDEGPAKGLHYLKPEMRSWITPVFADLNDEAQHDIALKSKTDVVFANYLLFHLNSVPAGKLANRWMSGEWSKHGFLSMAQVVVGETGEGRRAPEKLEKPLLDSFDGNVGAMERMYRGNVFQSPGSFKRVWREYWRRRSADGKRMLAATRAFMKEVYKDPFHAAPLDPAALAALEDASRQYGIEIRLTNEDMTVHYDAEGKRLFVGVGAALQSGSVAALSQWMTQELLGVPRAETPAAPTMTAWMLEGAPLTVETRESGPVVRWLADAFSPLTVAYRSDNANKSEKQLKREEELKKLRASVRGSSTMVRGFN